MSAIGKYPPVSRLSALHSGYRFAADRIRSVNARLPILTELTATGSRLNALGRLVEMKADPWLVDLMHEKVDLGLKGINEMLRPYVKEIADSLLNGAREAAPKMTVPELQFRAWVSPKFRQRIDQLTAQINDRLVEIRDFASRHEGDISALKITAGMRGGRVQKLPYREIQELEKAVQKFGDRIVLRGQDIAVNISTIRLSLEKFYMGLWEKGSRRS